MKFVSLISSGIDSPVATYLMAKKVKEMIFIHGDIKPFTDEREVENFKNLIKHLKNIINCPIKVFLLSHGNILKNYKDNCETKFTCVFCKRMLLRYAERIAERQNADAIVMGDNLGQVASQTLQNIRVIDQAVRIPVLRPLVGFDKQEIIDIAKRIGTYNLSILPSSGCSAVPNKPSTMAKIEVIIKEEKKLDIDNIVNKTIDNSLLFEI